MWLPVTRGGPRFGGQPQVSITSRASGLAIQRSVLDSGERAVQPSEIVGVALLGVLGALTAVPLTATVQIFMQELTKARREHVAAESAALEAPAPAAARRGYLSRESPSIRSGWIHSANRRKPTTPALQAGGRRFELATRSG